MSTLLIVKISLYGTQGGTARLQRCRVIERIPLSSVSVELPPQHAICMCIEDAIVS